MHSDRKAAAHLARAAGVRSLVLNYRRAPEHKFPAQIDDVHSAYDWLLQKGYQPDKIASVGHSVGGNLAISLALRLRDNGAALPGAILSISPWCDLTLSGKSIESNAERDKLLSRGLLEFFRSCWLDGTGVGFSDPQVNLLNADLSGLPPIAVFYGQDELLASEAFEFGLRAERAGNDVMVRPVEAGQHSFIIGAGRVPEVDDAIAEIGASLRTKLGLACVQETAKSTMRSKVRLLSDRLSTTAIGARWAPPDVPAFRLIGQSMAGIRSSDGYRIHREQLAAAVNAGGPGVPGHPRSCEKPRRNGRG
jgi:acetyl esterase/lipase